MTLMCTLGLAGGFYLFPIHIPSISTPHYVCEATYRSKTRATHEKFYGLARIKPDITMTCGLIVFMFFEFIKST